MAGLPIVFRAIQCWIGEHLLAVCRGILAARLAAEAQQGGKVYRIGYLSTPTRASVENGVQAFLRALQELTPITLHRHACSEVRNQRYARCLLAAQSRCNARLRGDFVPVNEELMR